MDETRTNLAIGIIMEVNGLKVPIAAAIAVLTFTFWLGGLSMVVSANEDEQHKHEQKPAHDHAIETLATVKADMKHNKETLEKIEAQQQRDKEEILRAIRAYSE